MIRFDFLLRAWARAHGLLYDERAQTLGEYGLITSVIGVSVIIIGVIAFREQISDSFIAMTNCVNGSC